MQPDISVIITTYNTAGYIQRAVDSALSQSGVVVEVILVDDVSSDNSWSVIESLTDPRIRKLKMDKNGGPSGARNAALALAQAPWVAVLDSDDSFAAGRLERLLRQLSESKADIIIDNLMVCHEEDGASFPMFDPARLQAMPSLSLADFIAGNQVFLGGYTLGYAKPIFSRAFLQQHQLSYDPDIRIGEDYFLLASALALGARCVVNAEASYNYTVRKGSISHRLRSADVERISACDQKLLARFKLDAAAQTAQARRTHNLHEAFAFSELVQAIKDRNIKGCMQAVALCPSCLIQLWRPISVRLQRLRKKVA